MAALIIALFVIVVVWGWYLMPRKTGAHKSSTLNIPGRRSESGGRKPQPAPAPEVTVIPAAGVSSGNVSAVPSGAGSEASARRRRVTTILVGAAVVSLAAALYTSSMNWWWTHLAVDGLLVLYYGLSMQLQETTTARVSPSISPLQQESRPAFRKVVGG